MPKKSKTLCVDDLRHAEYYGMQEIFDELYQKSQNGEVFNNLLDLILSKDNILLAYRNIKANKGSYTAGTDNKNITDIGGRTPDEVIQKVRFIVTGGEHGYRPKPVRRKDIPKPNGKTRPLGIPCIWDRLIQQCIKQILEPICEAKFSNNSYGFRPNRSVEHAINRTYTMLQMMNLHYVIEFDIKGFFDNVNHSKLIRQIWALGIHDKSLIFIIKRILTAPIRMPDNSTVIPDKGTPQGGIISPLLANIVLNELDWWVSSQWEENPIAVSRGRERIIGKTKVFDKSHGYRLRKRWSEFLGFKIRVRLKHHKYVVQSAICDKKVEIEREKLVEQAKNIAKPREKRSCLAEIQLFNSMVLGIQNYYQLATCISLDCRDFHRRIMTVLTNRLNTETGCMLLREGGTATEAEKERFGNSKMIRYVAGIDQMIYPIAYIKNKIPMAKRSAVCSYTADGRAIIHSNLQLNPFVLKGLREDTSNRHSTEYHDCKLSLFSAQKGKCAISGDEFTNATDIVAWLKTPKYMGGFERYKNMTLIHKRYLILLEKLPQAELKAYLKSLNVTKKMLGKINSLREQAGLLAII